MDYMQEFRKIMGETSDLALATAVDGTPNVRIVNFLWDETDKKLYFSTFQGMAKIEEIAKNNKVSFITIPVGNRSFVRVTEAVAVKSVKPIEDMRDAFVTKYPFFAQMFDTGLDKFVLYEIQFAKALVNLGFGEYGDVTL